MSFGTFNSFSTKIGLVDQKGTSCYLKASKEEIEDPFAEEEEKEEEEEEQQDEEEPKEE